MYIPELGDFEIIEDLGVPRIERNYTPGFLGEIQLSFLSRSLMVSDLPIGSCKTHRAYLAGFEVGGL